MADFLFKLRSIYRLYIEINTSIAAYSFLIYTVTALLGLCFIVLYLPIYMLKPYLMLAFNKEFIKNKETYVYELFYDKYDYVKINQEIINKFDLLKKYKVPNYIDKIFTGHCDLYEFCFYEKIYVESNNSFCKVFFSLRMNKELPDFYLIKKQKPVISKIRRILSYVIILLFPALAIMTMAPLKLLGYWIDGDRDNIINKFYRKKFNFLPESFSDYYLLKCSDEIKIKELFDKSLCNKILHSDLISINCNNNCLHLESDFEIDINNKNVKKEIYKLISYAKIFEKNL